MKGLTIESGFASIIRLLSRLAFSAEPLGIKDADSPNLAKIGAVTVPTLIIHGEYDSLIPFIEGESLFHNVAAKDKHLVVIPRANHNNIMWLGMEHYLEAIKEFVLA